MASILKVDELQGITAAGDITVTSEGGAATQSLQQGLAKSWAVLDGTGTISLDDSLNVASVADSGTGDYDFTHSSAFSSSNYCTTTAKNNASSNQGANLTLTNRSTTVRGVKSYENNSATDCSQVCFQTSGDLA